MGKVGVPLRIIDGPEPHKRKRFNKNKKKAWRKKIDLTDIDDALDEKNREERHGGPIEEQKSIDIFTLDFGDHFEKKHEKENICEEDKLSSGLKPRIGLRKLNKKLNCHKYLKGLPGVKPVSKKKPTQPQNVPKQIKRQGKALEGDLKSAIGLEISLQQSTKDRNKHKKSQKRSHLSHTFKKDLWNEDPLAKGPFKIAGKCEVDKSYLKEPVRYMSTVMVRSRKRPVAKKSSALPAVVIPKPGASYNPSHESHQRLLYDALVQQEQRVAQQVKEKRIIDQYVPKKDEGITKAEQLVEMSSGIPLQDEHDSHHDMVDVHQPEDLETPFVPKFVEKKTDQQRKKEKTRKVQELKKKGLKARKLREADVFKIKTFGKVFRKHELELKKERIKCNKKNRDAMFKPKKLGKHKFKEMDVAVALVSELPGSILDTKHISNPIEERLQAFQKRNLVEVTAKARIPKRKRTDVKKKTGKMSLDDYTQYVKPGTKLDGIKLR